MIKEENFNRPGLYTTKPGWHCRATTVNGPGISTWMAYNRSFFRKTRRQGFNFNLAAGIMVIAWLIALDFRKKAVTLDGQRFNLMQLGIAALTIAGVGSLVFAISMGLLAHPDMNILDNGSNASLLRWYQDVSDQTLPRAWVFSIPMWTYRIAMLACALWISFWLTGILKWGWKQFISPTIWYRLPPRIKRQKRSKEQVK
jgi:hypothetical protein